MRKDQYSLEDTELSIRLETAWSGVSRRLAQEIPIPSFTRFIKPLEAVSFDGTNVTISAPGKFVLEWVRERHLGTIQSFLSDELGQSIKIKLVAAPRDRQLDDAQHAAVIAPIIEPATKFAPNPKYTFENYVVGQSNRLAVAGSKAVASEPGAKYNPLFIYGPSGLGKTHLLHAIAREILAKDPKFPLVYISAQQFAEDFINALQSNRVEQFRRQNRQVGVWLVDDIQFIAGKDKTQEEIFHTFNYLHSLGKQIVFTSDRPPRDLFLMEERLRSRFEAGLVADVLMPDTETRCAIIQSKAQNDGVELAHEIAMFLAENVPGNIRVLEGSLTKLVVQASLEAKPISIELAKQMVETYYSTGSLAKPSFGQICETVSKHFKIPVDDIKGISRKAPIVNARHVVVFLQRELTHDSWKHIGHLLGDRDHTSMMHAYQKVTELMHHDKDFKAQVKSLLRTLHPGM